MSDDDLVKVTLSLGYIACPKCDWYYEGGDIVEQFHAYRDHRAVCEWRIALSDIDTPGCDCEHYGMGYNWHFVCTWKNGVRAYE